ncbi:unnamed protein product [Danaus chrysippus]|uniref:(African queen) hypothetical protein n=1 Tax=Danaus chrysippus TaxID=151541 RepID=A0A8J2QKY6_9NEOP|nr:unnamed protein product [Danaus chrysippus]
MRSVLFVSQELTAECGPAAGWTETSRAPARPGRTTHYEILLIGSHSLTFKDDSFHSTVHMSQWPQSLTLIVLNIRIRNSVNSNDEAERATKKTLKKLGIEINETWKTSGGDGQTER